jgi:hypothetical protein
MEQFAKPLMSVGEWVINHSDLVAAGFITIAGGIAEMKVLSEVNKASNALKSLAKVMDANPPVAMISTAVFAGTAIYGVTKKLEMAHNKAKKNNIAEHFGDISLSLDELDEIASQVVGKKNIEKLSYAMEELGKVSDLKDKFNESAESVSKLIWKVNAGFDLSEMEQESMKSSIDAMMENSLSMISQV